MKLFILFLYGFIVPQLIWSKEFESEVTRCHFGEEKCIADAINYLARKKLGDKEINMRTLSPLDIPTMSIKQGQESPVNIDLMFKNNQMHGLETTNTTKIKGFSKNLKGPHELHVKADHLIQLGSYSINGKVLILPIKGEGKSNITIVNPNFKITFTGNSIIKDNKTYMQIDTLKLQIRIKRMYTHLENLFNGDKALGDNMNKFLNENWMDIFGELKGAIEEAYAQLFIDVINDVFMSFPYNELFLPDN